VATLVGWGEQQILAGAPEPGAATAEPTEASGGFAAAIDVVPSEVIAVEFATGARGAPVRPCS
jgi:hypothetical protein